MKKIMLMACGIVMSLMIQNVQAQNGGAYVMGVDESTLILRDTLMIKLAGSDKIMIIGEDLQTISRYKNADSIKTIFIADWDKAVKAQTVSLSSKTVHYFIHSSGKRRMKAESEEYMEPAIDVTKEIIRLDLDLPSHQYFIHDLISGIEIQVYLQNPDKLMEELGGISLNDAITSITSNKKDMRKNYKMELTAKNNSYTLSEMKGNRLDAIELSPAFGIALLGNQFCPVIGADLYISLADKYRTPQIKFGVGILGYLLAEMNQTEVVAINGMTSFDAKFAVNMNYNSRAKAHWLGVSAGTIQDPSKGSMNKAFKFGIFSEGIGPLNYGFDFIRNNDGKYISSVKLVLPF